MDAGQTQGTLILSMDDAVGQSLFVGSPVAVVMQEGSGTWIAEGEVVGFTEKRVRVRGRLYGGSSITTNLKDPSKLVRLHDGS